MKDFIEYQIENKKFQKLVFEFVGFKKSKLELQKIHLGKPLIRLYWFSFEVRLFDFGCNHILLTSFRIMNGKFQLCSLYPGFKFLYRSISNGETSNWMKCESGDPVPNKDMKYEFVTTDGIRMSRIVK